MDTVGEEWVAFKEISAYLTLLEGGKPQDKLECETLTKFPRVTMSVIIISSHVPDVRHRQEWLPGSGGDGLHY